MPAFHTSDGAEIHYLIEGRGPVTLVFLHGWGGDAQTWKGVTDHLHDAPCRCLCLNLRGHGKSGVGSASLTWETFARDVLTVADLEQVQTFIPVGFSLGGKLSAYLAATFPDRVPAQVLVAPAAPGLVPVDRELGLRVCREAVDWRRGREFFKDWFSREADGTMVDAYCQTIAGTAPAVLQATAEMTLWTSLADVIGTLELPTLLVTGDNDPVYGRGYQEKEMMPFLNRVHQAELHSGHFIPLEQPAGLAALIAPFASALVTS